MKPFLILLALIFSAPSFAWDALQSTIVQKAASTSSPPVFWPGGIGVFTVVGTWNGATATLQMLGPDGTTLVTAGAATTFTANGTGVFYLPPGLIQATITGAGGSTSLYSSIGLVTSTLR